MSTSLNALFNLVLSIYILICAVWSLYKIIEIETFTVYPTFLYLFGRNYITFPLGLGNREENDVKSIASFELCIYFMFHLWEKCIKRPVGCLQILLCHIVTSYLGSFEDGLTIGQWTPITFDYEYNRTTFILWQSCMKKNTFLIY